MKTHTDAELVATLLFLSLGDPMTPERKQQILDAHQAVLDRMAQLRERIKQLGGDA